MTPLLSSRRGSIRAVPQIRTTKLLSLRKLAFAMVVVTSASLSLAEMLPKPTMNRAEKTDEAARPQKVATAKAISRSPLVNNDCVFVFTSGSDNTSLEYCVALNGNIAELQAPLAHPLISTQLPGEGYGICDRTDEGATVAYTDYLEEGASSNWGPATASPSGATSVKITRSTNDGIWTLTQTITQVAGTSSVKIAMTLRNNTAARRVAILLRYADVDADGELQNDFDGTTHSAFGWNSLGFGLLLQNAGRLGSIDNIGFGQSRFNPPDPCGLVNISPGPVLATDGSIVLAYGMEFPGSGSKTVTMIYKGL